jgi:hypothetical protein
MVLGDAGDVSVTGKRVDTSGVCEGHVDSRV